MDDGPREWSPRHIPPATEQGKELAKWLKGVTVVEGEGTVDAAEKGPTYVVIVHEGGSYHPAGVILADQNPYHNLTDQLFQTGFDMIRERFLKNTKHVEELKKEYGDDWEDVLMEDVGGNSWVFKDPAEAAHAIRTDDNARKFIKFIDSRNE